MRQKIVQRDTTPNKVMQCDKGCRIYQGCKGGSQVKIDHVKMFVTAMFSEPNQIIFLPKPTQSTTAVQ